MADRSGIEWTDATWSPVTGCTRVSDGCLHCYIERTPPFRMERRRFDLPVVGGTTGVRLHPDRLDVPLHWRKPRKVFVCSMADLFHDEVPDEYIVDVFRRMWWSPQHVFQVLTKRHARLRSLVPRIEERLRETERDLALLDCPTPLTWPLPNVWLGVSVESQRWADIRIPALLDTPAAVRWLSCEPLLGSVRLASEWLAPKVIACWAPGHRPDARDTAALAQIARAATRHFARENGAPAQGFVDWVVVGGESGPGARPMHPDWARSLRDQCVSAGVPFLFKQWGEWAPHDVARPTVGQLEAHGTHWDGTPAATAWVGKKHAGRVLDGQTWDQYPESWVRRSREDGAAASAPNEGGVR